MGTKQLRLSLPDQIKKRISDFKNKEINIVLTDGNVYFGKLCAISETDITLLNMRLSKKSYALNQISELYVDEQV